MSGSPGGAFACGALGSFDRERVLRTAATSGRDLAVVHEDERSILLLDREPIRWRAGTARGLGWVATDLWRPGPVAGWAEASSRGACGLVVDGSRRYLHSSVSGIGPLYWLDARGATYFASRIDPLVRSSPPPLSIDWDAWASIIVLRYPLGRRTPFGEISRLGPAETLRRRFGRARAKSERWPWAEVDPSLSLGAAAGAFSEALRETLRPLPGDLLSPLSGGRDSRMLTATLAADGRVATALTVADDEGEGTEESLAAPVAAALGVRHEALGATAADYPRDWEDRATLVEHQFVDHAWLVPLARRLDGYEPPFPDGFAIDVFCQSKRHFNPPKALGQRNPRAAGGALFDGLRRYGRAELALSPELREPLLARARVQFEAATRRFEGHPSQNLLSTYATRSVRGVACYPGGLLAGARVVAPGACDAVVRAALSTTQAEKRGGRLYEEVFDRLAASVGRLPSTADVPRGGPRLARRWRGKEAVESHRRRLAEGPFADCLSDELRLWLAAPAGVELSGDLRLGLESVSLLHSWWRRYRDVLAPVNSEDLAG